MATTRPIRTPKQAFSAYVQAHPDLAAAYAKSGSTNMAKWGSDHWTRHGKEKNEKRLTPHSFRFTEEGRTNRGPFESDAERKQRGISEAMAAIQGLFGGREAYYNKYLQDIYGLSERGILRDYADAEKQRKFHMLRTGLDQGPQDIYGKQRLETQKAEGLASAMNYARNQAMKVRMADFALKQKLMGAAGSGALTTDMIPQYGGSLMQAAATAWPGMTQMNWAIPGIEGMRNAYGYIPGIFSDDDDEYSGVAS